MYEHELALIDKVISMLMSKIYISAAEEIKKTKSGADELLPLLEHELCLHLTKGESANIKALQAVSGRSVDVAKMIDFLNISCAEYLFLKEVLAMPDIHNVYYDTRVHERGIVGYNQQNCLQIFTYSIEKLDSSTVEEHAAVNKQQADKYLKDDENIRALLSDSYAEMFLRIQDGTLQTDGLGIQRDIILPNLGPVSANVFLENVTVTTTTSKMLLLFSSLYQNCNIFDRHLSDRHEFIKNLFKMIKLAQEGLSAEATEPSEKSEARCESYQNVIEEAERMLNAIRNLFPSEFAWIEENFLKEEARNEILNCRDLEVLVPLDIDNARDRSDFIADLLKYKKSVEDKMVSKRIDYILSLVEIAYPGDVGLVEKAFLKEEARKKLSNCNDLYIFVPSDMDDPADRNEFIIQLLKIKENMEKDKEHSSIEDQRTCNRIMDILGAVETVYPGEVRVVMARESESKRIVQATLREQQLSKPKDKEPANEENDIQLVKGESAPQYVDVQEENKQRIDSFINWMKSQPIGRLERTYSKCIVELTARYALFLNDWDSPDTEQSALINKFRQDALGIIKSKITESSKLGSSYNKLIILNKAFIRQTMISSSSASSVASSSSSRVASSSSGSSGNDSPPSSSDKQHVAFFQKSELDLEVPARSDSKREDRVAVMDARLS